MLSLFLTIFCAFHFFFVTYRVSLCLFIYFLIVPEQNHFVPCLGRGHMTLAPIERALKTAPPLWKRVEAFNRGKRAVESTLHWGKGYDQVGG
jgi:hypothetical protein